MSVAFLLKLHKRAVCHFIKKQKGTRARGKQPHTNTLLSIVNERNSIFVGVKVDIFFSRPVEGFRVSMKIQKIEHMFNLIKMSLDGSYSTCCIVHFIGRKF